MITRMLVDRCDTGALVQMIVAEYTVKHSDDHVTHLTAVLKEKRDTMIAAVRPVRVGFINGLSRGFLNTMSTTASEHDHMSSTDPTIELLEAIGDAFNRHDVDAIVDFFTEDGEFLNATGPEIFGSRHVGKSGLRAFFSGLMAKCPDIRWEPIDNRVSGDKGYSEWRRTCTLPDGTVQDWLGLDIFTFRDGKVLRKDTYFKRVD